MPYLVIDTEATDKYPSTAEVLSVAIIDHLGTVLLDTLVRPVLATSWPAAYRIHGIAPTDVLRPDIPTLAELNPIIADLIRGQEVVIYNAQYDATILREAFALGPPAAVHCCMLTFSEHPEVRSWNDYHSNWRWHSLVTAADRVGHVWRGAAHGALPDCYAARDVWAWLTSPEERARLEAAAEERRVQYQVNWYLEAVWNREQQAVDKAAKLASTSWEEVHFSAMGILERRRPLEWQAADSADVFSRHLTGYSVHVWNGYGKMLKLKRYGQPDMPAQPKYLVSRTDVYFLRPAWRPADDWPFESSGARVIQPTAMRQDSADFPNAKYGNELTPLFNLKKLTVGVDYVPYCHDYQPGYCSKTALVRDHKLKPKQADQVRPAFLLVRKKYDDYLLYPIPAPISQPETPALVGTETHGE